MSEFFLHLLFLLLFCCFVLFSLKVKSGEQSSLVCEAEEQNCVLEQPALFLFVCLFVLHHWENKCITNSTDQFFLLSICCFHSNQSNDFRPIKNKKKRFPAVKWTPERLTAVWIKDKNNLKAWLFLSLHVRFTCTDSTRLCKKDWGKTSSLTKLPKSLEDISNAQSKQAPSSPGIVGNRWLEKPAAVTQV